MSTTLKFALLLLGAAVMALIARMLFANMMTNQKPADPPAQIRVAAGNLPAGLLLREEDLAWKGMEKSSVPKGALLKGTPAADTMAGVLVRRDTQAGAPILAQEVIRPDAPGFLAAVLKPGMRAVSVSIDNVSGNAGLIQPGDYVDMILTQTTRSGDSGVVGEARGRSVVSETVVENVRVIAVGSVFQHQPEDIEVRKNRTPARTVTIEVAQRAAEAVTVASRLGTLSMALRSFAVADRNAAPAEQTETVVAWGETENKTAPVWASDVSRAIGRDEPFAAPAPAPAAAAPPPERAAGPREIVVMRGSKREVQKLAAQ